MYRTLGVALEHRAALVGMKVQAATRSESASENRKCRAMFAQLRIPRDHWDTECSRSHSWWW